MRRYNVRAEVQTEKRHGRTGEGHQGTCGELRTTPTFHTRTGRAQPQRSTHQPKDESQSLATSIGTREKASGGCSGGNTRQIGKISNA